MLVCLLSWKSILKYIGLNDWHENRAPAKKVNKMLNKHISGLYELRQDKIRNNISMLNSLMMRVNETLMLFYLYSTKLFQSIDLIMHLSNYATVTRKNIYRYWNHLQNSVSRNKWYWLFYLMD